MKIQITQSTTIAGKDIAAGEVVDVDAATFGILRSQNQAVEIVVKPAPQQETAPEKTEPEKEVTPQPETTEPTPEPIIEPDPIVEPEPIIEPDPIDTVQP